MIAALIYVPTDRVVEYYETVILGILEEKENEEVNEEEEDEVEEDEGEEKEPDDSSWASWLKEIYSYCMSTLTTLKLPILASGPSFQFGIRPLFPEGRLSSNTTGGTSSSW